MSLIYTEGFDIYNTSANLTGIGGYVVPSGSPVLTFVTGRFTGQALHFNQSATSGTLRTSLPASYSTLIVGTAWRPTTNALINTIIGFADSGTPQLYLVIDNSNRILISRNGTTLATSTATLTVNVWYYIELKVTFNNSGSYAVRVNGAPFAGLPDTSGVDTTATANNTANQLLLCQFAVPNANSASDYDDLYVCDTSGSANNDFLGDVEVRTLLPNAAGANSNWTKTGGSTGSYTAVNENPYDSDTSYVSSATLNTIDTYGYPDLPSNAATVFGVVSNLIGRKDDAGNRDVTTRYRADTTTEADFTATDLTLSASYTQLRQIQETNPVTLTSWTVADVNNGEFGPKVSA